MQLDLGSDAHSWYLGSGISSVENQNGVFIIQQCYVENQKDVYAVQVYGDSSILVLNGTLLNNEKALLALSRRYVDL